MLEILAEVWGGIMANVCRDGLKRAPIGGTISAVLAARLQLEQNKSAVLEDALNLYYEKIDAMPKIEIKKCQCSRYILQRAPRGHHMDKKCPLYKESTPEPPKEPED